MFSGGKDSIVCLDLASRHFKKIVCVYLYFVKGLSFKESHFQYYSRRYNVEILQYPRCEDLSRQINSNAYSRPLGKKIPTIKQFEMDLFLRRKLGIEWIIYGYKRADSLSRRGILNSNCAGNNDGGIDGRNHKIYPLANWSNKKVLHYIKMKKLPLSVEYGFNFRDINNFKGETLLWLYHNYPRDYLLVKKQYPFIEAALIRARGTEC